MKKIFVVAMAIVMSTFGLSAANAATATAGASSGAIAGASSGGNNLSTIINGGKAAKIPVGTPGTTIAPVSPPQLFGAGGTTSVERGVSLTLWYSDVCAPVATRNNVLQPSEALGTNYAEKHSPSYKTDVTFIPTQYLRSEAKKGVTGYGRVQEVESSRILFRAPKGKYTCLGLMTVTAKKGQSVPLSIIISDAQRYALDNMDGFRNVLLVSLPGTIGNAGGVSNEGTGMSFNPGLAIANVATAGMLGIGFSDTKGSAVKTAQLGTTFVVVSDTTKDQKNSFSFKGSGFNGLYK